MKKAIKIGQRVVAFILVALVALVVYLRVEQAIYRHNAEKLLAEYHSIHLLRSNWQDATAIMGRWNGRTDDVCDASTCGYAISINLPSYKLVRLFGKHGWQRSSQNTAQFLTLMGDRFPIVMMTFVVQDSVIVRDSFVFVIQDGERTLISSNASQQNLSLGVFYLQGEGLGNHPDYTVSRPSSCKIDCEDERFRYTPYLSQDEIVNHTNLGISCITRLFRCKTMDEVAPSLKPWHLYSGTSDELPNPPSCNISARVLGREAATVVIVDIESAKKAFDRGYQDTEFVANGKIHALLKADPSFEAKSEITLVGRAPLQPGHRYVVFLDDDRASREHSVATFCGSLEANEITEREVQLGVDQSKPLRRNEHVYASVWDL